ncbi:MAG: restriction endonuclease subunit S, partial [Burkholderiales bacterium]|nr:restriction endonuclease subunit S [Burkholderiales bacterium]
IINLSYGAGQPNISQDIIKNFNLSYPPLEEQQQIAEYLDQQTAKIDALVNKAKSMVVLLKEHKQSLINNVVIGKINVLKTNI